MRTDETDREILIHLSNGMTTKEIAGHVNLTEAAVKKRMKRMRKESGTKNTVELVSYAHRTGVSGLPMNDSF